jgi:hypothetical protein
MSWFIADGRCGLLRISEYYFFAEGSWPGGVQYGWKSNRHNLRDPSWQSGLVLWEHPAGANWSRASAPLWLPFLLTAAPTALLWYRNRRTPAGHCKTCRYDLTGITTGICPECGTATGSEAAE